VSPIKAFPDRIQRTGSQVAVYYAQGAKGKKQEFPVRVVLGMTIGILNRRGRAYIRMANQNRYISPAVKGLEE